MRTLIILTSGILLVAALLSFSRLFSEHYPAASTWATGAFLAIWLAAVGFNM